MTYQSTLSVGSTGCGKTQHQLVEILRAALEKEYAIVVLDGKGSLAFQAAGQLIAYGQERRIIYDELPSRDGRALAWDFLPGVEEHDPFAASVAKEVVREEFKQLWLAKKGLVSDEDKGFTREVMDLAVGVMLNQRPRKPLPWVHSVFLPKSERFQVLAAECTDEGLKRQLLESARSYMRMPTQYEQWVGAARRMLEGAKSSVVQTRCQPDPGAGIEWTRALEEKRIVLFNGAGLPVTTVRTVFLSAALQVVNACRRYYAKNRKPLRALLILEECGAYRLAAPFILVALQELREAGLAVRLMTQSTLDFESDALEKILTNTPGGHYWFKLFSEKDQERGAGDLANPTFNPLEVHYTRKRLVHDGMEEYHHTVTGKSKDKHEKTIRVDERDAVNFLPKYREEVEEYYKTPQLHKQEFMTDVANLRVGEYFVRDMQGVRKVQGKMLEAAWPFGLAEKRTLEALSRIRSQSIYQPARLLDIPPTPAPAQAPPPPAAGETGTAKLRRRATRKSKST